MTRILLALAFTAFVALTLWAQEAQKREMRTVWIATVSNIDWPQTRGTGTATINKQKKQLTDLLDGFVKANMNSVCLQVRPMADALYKSSYEPWSSYLTGTRGQDPGWDPLAFAVEECHKRGLEINAWVNPYRFSNSSGNDCTTAIDKQLKNSGILMQVGNRIVFNPALKASRDHLLKVCKEMIQNYDIDGIIFDDYFYPGGGTPEDSSAPDYQLYTQSNSGMSIGDWRRANVNQMVKDMWDMVQATKPYVKFSIGPAGVAGQRSTSATKHGVVPVDEYCRASDWQYTTIYSDPLAWLEEGTIDYISPQLYWKTTHVTNPFGPLTNWWSYIAEHFGRHHYASHNIYFMAETNTKADWDEILQQIRYSRQYNRQNAPGVNFYSAKYIDGPTCKGFSDYLSQTLFTHKALEPAMPWHSKTNYDAPANLAYSGGTLSWTGVNKKLVRYSVYAVPLTVTLDEAQSQAFDGIKSDYLVGVTYTPSFKLDASLQSGYWYAVCVVDGWNNEFAPAFYNLATEYADKVTLVSPIAGAAATWNQQFAWTAADGATYELQISDDASFGNVLIQRKQITSNTTTIDLGDLASGQTYYWRVATLQPNRLVMWSDAATFKAPVRTPAEAVALVSPANGASFDADFVFKFTPVTAHRFKLQVSKTADFAQVAYETTDFATAGNQLSANCVVSVLGKGTFYWRVVSSRKYYSDKASEVRRFTITKVPIGELEPGYVMKQDIDANAYDAVNGYRLTNKWVRSVKSEYGNINFENKGQLNRGFAVVGDTIYVSGRESASTIAPAYLYLYSADTGERIKRMPLGYEATVPYYPCNDVQTDHAGNLVISNLTLNVGTTPLVLLSVDKTTGALTKVASVTFSGLEEPRIDHCAVAGDVKIGDFSVFACPRYSTKLLRWQFRGGKLASQQSVTMKGYAPSHATTSGIAPQLYAQDENIVYINGSGIYFTRYNFATGAIDGAFSTGSPMAPEGTNGNGGTAFTLGGAHYMLYPSGDFNSSFNFNLVQNTTDTSFDGHQLMWCFPKRGLGNVNSDTWSAQCTAVPVSATDAMLYLYVPGNGMAAYLLSKNVKFGDVNGDGNVDVSDVTALINMILGTTPANLEVADINADGILDVTDVTALINEIL